MHRSLGHRSLACAALLAGALIVTGCADDAAEDSLAASGPSASPSSAGDPIAVVASTNVYGDIVSTIGGDRVEVTSIIDGSSADQDPHSFEVSPRDQLAVSEADLVIENGGGYDDFMGRLVSSLGGERRVITAVEAEPAESTVSADSTPAASPTATETATSPSSTEAAEDGEGHSDEEGHSDGDEDSGEDGHGHGEGNEHVWYDLDAMAGLAEEIADALAAEDPDSRTLFEDNAASFRSGIEDLQARQAEIRAAHSGAAIAITEPLPLYLVEEAGLVDRTPTEFSEAIEEGTDAPARILSDTLALMSSNSVEALVYNDQTTGPQTEAVRNAAEDAGVPVVAMSETLPEGSDFLGWMGRNLDALQDALGGE